VIAAVLATAAALSPVTAATAQFDPSLAAGYMTVDLRGTRDTAAGVGIDADGKIVLGATSRRPASSLSDAGFIRLTTTGAIDSTFGDGTHRAFVTLPESVTLLDFGMFGNKIVGLARGPGSKPKNYLFRLNADGSLDTASDGDPSTHFGTNGFLTITPDASAFVDGLLRVAVEPDGRVVTAGTLRATGMGQLFVQVKGFKNDGAFDYSTAITLGSSDSLIRGLAISQTGARAAVVTASKNNLAKTEIGLLVIDTATGDPDTTFSGDGHLVLGSATKDITPGGVAFRFDGQISVAAVQSETFVPQTLFAAWHPDGTLDHGFGGSGVVHVSSTPGSFNRIQSFFVTSTGRYTAVGEHAPPDVAAVRVTAQGVLDTGLGGDGDVQLIPPADFFTQAAVQASNGRTVVVGSVTAPGVFGTSHLGIVRFMSSGQGDVTFGNIAFRHYTASSNADIANAVTVASDGGIIVAGRVTQGATSASLVKLLPNGYRDPDFGNHGRSTPTLGTLIDTEARAVAMSGLGAVFAGCVRCAQMDRDFLVGRLKPNGALDSSFSSDGFTTTDFASPSGTDEVANGVTVQTDGKIVAVGQAGADFAVARYTTAGDPDPSFSGDGHLVTDIVSGSNDEAFDVAVQTDGKVVVVGRRNNGTNTRIVVVRYTSRGVPDPSFGGGDGIVITAIGPASSEARGVAIRPDGRIVVAGFTSGGLQQDIVIARYLTDGTLDPALDGDGKLLVDVTGADDFAMDVAAVGNKIVIAGGAGNDANFLVARFLGTGALDTTFSGDGIEIGPFSSLPASGMAIQSDGAIVLAGADLTAQDGLDTVVARYKP